MGGGNTTPSVTALLCLGTRPKPSIRADRGLTVPKGSPVTIWCQGSPQADVYRLYKVGGSGFWEAEAPQDSSNTAGFPFESLSSYDAGRYQCAYHSGDGWSGRSDPLPLVVTGVYAAPSLSAQPSPVVATGGSVSLSCSSRFTWGTSGTLHLLKEGGADRPQHREWSRNGNSARRQGLFSVGPVNASHGGTYRCYDSPGSQPYVWSQPSDPLHLQVTGVYREPSLSAQPGSPVPLGERLTLQCRSDAGFGRFALTKDEGSTPPPRLDGQHSPDFPLGRVSPTQGGRYRCYAAHNLSAWSAPSAPLDVLIRPTRRGMYRKPTLSAHPGTSVSWGEKVTLRCRSEIWLDTFHLSKEGSLTLAQSLRLQEAATPIQANFTLSPVTSAHNGTYRCYSSQSSSPYLLSQPSDPLELLISGEDAGPGAPGPDPRSNTRVGGEQRPRSPRDRDHRLLHSWPLGAGGRLGFGPRCRGTTGPARVGGRAV
uniref:Ig-like domain-containing protein n=1 Tax=Catagonus wagneri TaxID=51154 RepID=A0A8C3X4X6_9CETA